MSERISRDEQLRSLWQVATYRPTMTVGIVLLSVVVAALEGIGLGFILPIVEVVRNGSSDPSGPARVFVLAYDALGLPFTLEYIVAGVTAVIASGTP